ncbi:MAG: discoidin domain-containing protein [Verrucomicrobiae bacterium]|nr:discoidin domain-containing protein [Verrucomicrobiae bacterium]
MATFVAAAPVTLTVDLDHPAVITNAATALGGAIDGHEKGDAEKNLSSKSVKKMVQASLKPLAYRLRTELGVEAWHWNPVGTWSDEKNQCGYWASSTVLQKPIEASYGYRLPRRGDTLDEANNDSCSRLDDGNSNTFWKSNPYLTSHYTGESDKQHPQWVVLDFGKPVLINAARLHWREPYAKKFKIQYATGGDLYFGHNKAWHDFPHGKISDGRGGAPLLDLGAPRMVQYVRILMTEPRGQFRNLLHLGSGLKSNAMAPNVTNYGTDPLAEHTDPRDHMGYALQEVEIGFLKKGIFTDHVVHRPDQKQTMVTVSSTDPWHRASDLDEKTEQPGIDAVATSRLGNNQPILWSLPVFYDTPENATALVAYLKQRGYLMPHQRIELGEEPDGQHVDPKDFGELYCQVIQLGSAIESQKNKFGCDKSIHSHSKNLMTDPQMRNSMADPQFGGPSFVTIDCQPKDTTYRFDHRLWLRPFLKQLRHHHREKDFQFLTFEWYPFDEILLPAPELLRKQSGSLRRAMNLIWHGGVPKSMPLLITEYGYSVFSGEPEVKMEAALLNAEIASEFLLAGGTTAYLYGYEPNTLECGINNSWGNLMMLLEHGKSLIPLPTFYAAQIMTECVKEKTKLFPVKSSQRDLSAYAFHQQNSDRWTFLCINKSPTTSYQVTFGNQSAIEHVQNSLMWMQGKERGAQTRSVYEDTRGGEHRSDVALRLSSRIFNRFLEKISYSSKNYLWHADGPNGFPSKNEPPQHELISAGAPVVIDPWSLTILKSNRSDELF